MGKMRNAPPPGGILSDASDAIGYDAEAFARPPSLLPRVLQGKGRTADSALRVSAAVGAPSPDVRLKMQTDHDLRQAERTIDLSDVSRIRRREC